MQEKIGRIEEELRQLSTELSQLLDRVDNIRHMIDELKDGLAPQEPAPRIEPETATVTEAVTDIGIMEVPESEESAQADEPQEPEQPEPVAETENIETLYLSGSDNQINETELPPIPPLAALTQEQEDEDKEEATDNIGDDIATDAEDIDTVGAQPTNLDDLRKLFTINDKYRFRRELFGNDGIAMTDTINMIAAMRSMSEVEEYVYSDLEWDKDNDDVRAFMDIITFYFLQKR